MKVTHLHDFIGSFILLLGGSRTSADDCDLSPPLKLVPQTSDDVVRDGGREGDCGLGWMDSSDREEENLK